MKNVLILGGAGFIGSNIAEALLTQVGKVTIIDGLYANTGGNIQNISNFKECINFVPLGIENVTNLKSYVSEADLIIDVMGWTSHLDAIAEPFYDLKLNCESHLYLIKELKKIPGKKVIYLSSRGVYGKVNESIITEHTFTAPLDVQGTHKLASENYFRIFSKLYKFDTIVLRIPNCYGKNQIYKGRDLGLVGNLIRQSLKNENIEVYGKDRRRNLLYVNDLVQVIIKLVNLDWKGFFIYNVSGQDKLILELAETIVAIVKKGQIVLKELPQHVLNIDSGNAIYEDKKLKDVIGEYLSSDFKESIQKTIEYFKSRYV
jgi:nucleoside-diphosphate-sugar epimerase